MGWPLKVRGSLQSLAFKGSRRLIFSVSFRPSSGRAQRHLPTRHLAADIFSISYYKSPLDREEGLGRNETEKNQAARTFKC